MPNNWVTCTSFSIGGSDGRCSPRYIVAEWEMLGIIGGQKRNRPTEVVEWPNWLEQGEGTRQQKTYRCKDRTENLRHETSCAWLGSRRTFE
jgi:hypothetical protein